MANANLRNGVVAKSIYRAIFPIGSPDPSDYIVEISDSDSEISVKAFGAKVHGEAKFNEIVSADDVLLFKQTALHSPDLGEQIVTTVDTDRNVNRTTQEWKPNSGLVGTPTPKLIDATEIEDTRSWIEIAASLVLCEASIFTNVRRPKTMPPVNLLTINR